MSEGIVVGLAVEVLRLDNDAVAVKDESLERGRSRRMGRRSGGGGERTRRSRRRAAEGDEAERRRRWRREIGGEAKGRRAR